MTDAPDYPVMPVEPLAVDLNEAARMIGLSSHTVRRRAKAGDLEWYHDGKLMITYESLVSYVERKVEQNGSGMTEAA